MDRCLAALQHHHLIRAREDFDESLSSNSIETSFLQISGSQVAARFAQQASQKLNAQECSQLEAFLLRISPATKDRKGLREKLEKILAQFYATEVDESGEDQSRLARPSGHEDAEIGILMHLQTKKVVIAGMWDMTNASIQALAAKGFCEDDIFGFDWHWRAESSSRSRGMCPATKWKPALKGLHDKLSCDVLDTLPLPLLLVAGSCARAEYEKTLQSSARRLTLILEPTLVLSLDLDFQAHKLRRMTAYIDHPAAMLFGTISAANSAACLDATLNFYLWLIGKSHDPVSLQRRYMRFGKGLPPLTAPTAELDAAIVKKVNEGRVLNEREYSGDFRA